MYRFDRSSSLAAIGGIADMPSGARRVEDDPSRHEQRPGVGASANYRSEITSPLRSAATISPIWRPDSVSTAPFWLTRTIPPAPGPTAMPAPAAPYTPLTSNGVRMLLTSPTKSVAEAPKVNP